MSDEKEPNVTLQPTKNNLAPIDAKNLYQSEIIVDPDHGEICVMTPVTDGGSRDVSRARRYLSSITVTFQGMPQQIRFELKASTLAEAVAAWPDQALAAGEQFIAEAESKMMKARLTGQTGAARMPVLPRMN